MIEGDTRSDRYYMRIGTAKMCPSYVWWVRMQFYVRKILVDFQIHSIFFGFPCEAYSLKAILVGTSDLKFTL